MIARRFPLALLLLEGCDLSSTPQHSDDGTALQNLVKFNLPINTVRWEIFQNARVYSSSPLANRLRCVDSRDRTSHSSSPGQHSRNGMDHTKLCTRLVISRFQNTAHATQQFEASLIPCRTLHTTPSQAHKIRREGAGLSLQWQS